MSDRDPGPRGPVADRLRAFGAGRGDDRGAGHGRDEPGPDGADRPLTLQIVQMRSAGAFDGADFFALQNPQAALGGEFIKADQVALTPGAAKTLSIGLDAATTVIGVIAGFRDPAGKVFRAKAGVSATESVTFSVEVSRSGVTLRAA
ncbi:MAG: type VI secretion system lipoprotein TssJ [Rhodobacter sp.]|nr:type VI secretion system lipoprotein TssJ [Rhodobacter sp.]